MEIRPWRPMRAGTGAVAQRNGAVAARSAQLVGTEAQEVTEHFLRRISQIYAPTPSNTTSSWTCWCEGPLEQGSTIWTEENDADTCRHMDWYVDS